MWWQVPSEGNGAALGMGPSCHEVALAWDHPGCGTIPKHETIFKMGPAWHGAMLHGTTLQHPGAETTLRMGHPGCGTTLGPPSAQPKCLSPPGPGKGQARALLQELHPFCPTPGDKLQHCDRPVQQHQPPLRTRPPCVLCHLTAPRPDLLPGSRHPLHPGAHQTSVLCKAAVHAGVIADELGGQVTLSREKGITLYESAFANGLRSKRGSLSEKRLVFHKACDDVLEVVTFNASSWWHEVDVLGQDRAWVAEQAALSTTGHSWAAEPGAEAAWLELDLGTRRNVTGIITKGSSEQHDYYVTSYRVSSSRDGKNWRPYRGNRGQEDKVFEGNADSQGEVSNVFIPPIIARYIRITPHSWHQRVALKVALVGCQLARVRVPHSYVPSVPREVLEPTSHPASRTPIPGIALDPEKAGSTLLVMLLIGGFVFLCSCLLLLAFLCHRKRKSAVELNCGITKGYPMLESSQVCSLQSLPAPSLASFTMAPTPGDLSWTHSPEYTEPDLVQVSPSSQTGPSTFKPLLEEGYTLPLVLNHYDIPGKHHEYAEPLPPEPEYAMPFSELEPAGMRRSTCIIAGPAGCSPVPYQTPALQPGELPAGVERTGSPCSEGSRGLPRHCPLAHVYQEAL
ncbi:discoidin, CUB and LCCL domain-containing protein 1 isoform X7 [Taeniopygia guttata]|uniref:discoidin, CUB and LCCL domain-containing protein 1 isoform X7 n=1 Tax=Taeniopygia guttata TaxID=59729 RepID=UPI0013F2A66C